MHPRIMAKNISPNPNPGKATVSATAVAKCARAKKYRLFYYCLHSGGIGTPSYRAPPIGKNISTLLILYIIILIILSQ